MIYKEPQSYKAYHLFLIQNLCIHVSIGYQEPLMATIFYCIHKLFRTYCLKDGRIKLRHNLSSSGTILESKHVSDKILSNFCRYCQTIVNIVNFCHICELLKTLLEKITLYKCKQTHY